MLSTSNFIVACNDNVPRDNYEFPLIQIGHIKVIQTYFSGLARTLCPIVTKLVSWFDINQARDDTLQSIDIRC
jgi:hypothetical protein